MESQMNNYTIISKIFKNYFKNQSETSVKKSRIFFKKHKNLNELKKINAWMMPKKTQQYRVSSDDKYNLRFDSRI